MQTLPDDRILTGAKTNQRMMKLVVGCRPAFAIATNSSPNMTHHTKHRFATVA